MKIHKYAFSYGFPLVLFLIFIQCREKNVCKYSLSEYATLKLGEKKGEVISIINGRLISPAGIQIEVGSVPYGMAISPDNRFLAVSNNGAGDLNLAEYGSVISQSITVIDLEKRKRAFDIVVPSLFVGIQFSPDGKYLFASGGGGNVVRVYSATTYPFTETAVISIKGYPTGIGVTPDGRYLLVTVMHEHKVVLIEIDSWRIVREVEVRAYPYDVEVTPDGRYAVVSNWGDSSVSIIDLSTFDTTLVDVGKNPEGIVVSHDGRAFVASSDSDQINVISIPDFSLLRDVSLKEGRRIGVSPVDVALSPDEKVLFVSCAGDNKVAVISTEDYTVKGYIPTGYYPVDVEVSSDGSEVYVLNAKGQMGRANPNNEFVAYLVKGTVSIIPMPDDTTLPEMTDAVVRNNDIARSFFSIPPECERLKNNPIPVIEGDESPIKHVVYIVKENKTFDAVLGDLAETNPEVMGDPSLTLFGREITPNTHALAEEFSLCDNFYEESEQSLQGHIWISLGWVNDFSEKNWIATWARPEEAQYFLPGIEPSARPGDITLFENLYDNGISFRIYGDILGIANDPLNKFYKYIDWKYPTWALHVNDVEKANEFIRELNEGIFPSFVYIWLPNDHTLGTTPGAPTPTSMVADNDHALGMVVEAITHSPFWKETVIFIFEDDPQGTPDHIEAHRSFLIVVSPYVKRGYVSHVHYSFPSIHRTMEMILGLPPVSRYDELAPPMYDLFSDKADYTPYIAIPRQVPIEYNTENTVYSELSKQIRFDLPDMENDILGEIIWKAVKGTEMPER